MLSFVVAYNKKDVLEQNFLSSSCINEGKYQIIIEKGKSSASLTYNSALDNVNNQYVVFAHQDVYFPTGWDERLLIEIKNIEKTSRPWGVIGCIGINSGGSTCGHVYSNGLGRILGSSGSREKASTIDEMVIVLNRKAEIQFDNKLPGYHLYGTDICFEAKKKRLENYIIKNFCIHNSLPVINLDNSFWKACNFIRKKWSDDLPITTTCIKLSKNYINYLIHKTNKNISYFLAAKSKGFIERIKNPKDFTY